MTPLRAALAYAGHGWRVAPAGPGKKHPFLDHWQERATADVNEVARWFAGPLDFNVCIATGEASGIWVLDVDDKEPCATHPERGKGSCKLAELERENGPLPDTWTVGTGSGGLHHYFAWDLNFDLRNSAGKLGPGLDTRGNGGQVVAPPSQVSDPTHFQSYTLLSGTPPVPAPKWLTWLLRPQKQTFLPRPAGVEQFLAGGQGILGWLATVQPGGQDNALSWVVRALRDDGVTAEDAGRQLWDVVRLWPTTREPWTVRDIERHIRSAY